VSAGSIAELCKDPEAEAWILAELQATGKENKCKVGDIYNVSSKV
jgi:hypothetical protein